MNTNRFLAVVLTSPALLVMFAPRVQAQCDAGLPGFPSMFPGGSAPFVHELARWSPFGAFPNYLVAAGSFMTMGGMDSRGLALWNGQRWFTLGDAAGSVYAVIEFRTAGSIDDLIVAGSFQSIAGVPARRVARYNYNASVWEPLGAGPGGTDPREYVSALAVYNSQIVAGYTTIIIIPPPVSMEIPRGNVARWTGSTWQVLGSLSSASVSDLAVHNGELIAAANQVLRWTGSSWEPLGGGVNGVVLDLHVSGNELIVAGAFTQAGGVTVNNIAHWSRSGWGGFGGGLPNAVYKVAEHGGSLYAMGAARVSRWTGAGWIQVGPLLYNGATPDNTAIFAAQPYGADLFVGGVFSEVYEGDSSSDPYDVPGLAVVRGETLDRPTLGLEGRANGILIHEGEPIVYGALCAPDSSLGEPRANIARWTGTSWTTYETPGQLQEVTAASVLQSVLHVATRLYSDVLDIRRRSGNDWETLASVTGQSISVLGERSGRLVAAGRFIQIGGSNASNLADWDGMVWRPIGGGTDGAVYAVMEFAGDLYVGGEFAQAGGLGIANIARWNPTDGWRSLGAGVNGAVNALSVHDGALIVGGAFTSAGGIARPAVARWDGASWSSFGAGLTGGMPPRGIHSLYTYNGDLIAAGSFSQSGAVALNNLARWNGSTWQPMGDGVDRSSGRIGGLVSHGGELFIAGDITAVDSFSSALVGRWSDTGTPTIAVQPVGGDVASGGDLAVEITPGYGYGALTYQWHRNGVPVSDGPGGASPGGGTVYGAQETQIEIDGIMPSDAGKYTCEITNACGSVTSEPANLTVDGQSGVPAATVTGAVLRKPNTAGPGGFCELPIDLNAGAPITSEPRNGRVTELCIAFDVTPGGPGANPVTLEEDISCPPPPNYAAYTGSSTVGAAVAGNELVLTFSPALENARTYRLTIGSDVTSTSGQSVEVRGLFGDVDNSGRTNGADRSFVVGVWTSPANFSCQTDLDNSGRTNGADRSFVVSSWTGGQNCAP